MRGTATFSPRRVSRRPTLGRRLPLLVAVLSLTSLARVEGQRLAIKEFPQFRPTLVALENPGRPPEPAMSRARDFRWEGVAIGGGIGGLLGAILIHGFCSDPDSNASGKSCLIPTIEGLLAGAVVGGTIGGIIGTSIRKKPDL